MAGSGHITHEGSSTCRHKWLLTVLELARCQEIPTCIVAPIKDAILTWQEKILPELSEKHKDFKTFLSSEGVAGSYRF